MWADDLYMSVPFLCRYYQLTGDRKYIDDAARQVLGFKKRLFIPELKVMSHVYDFKRGMATGVPWGRANGWTIFSLSELLAVLPVKHPRRPAVLEMFRQLCEGYLALQDPTGMWHQVLTHPDAYPELPAHRCSRMRLPGASNMAGSKNRSRTSKPSSRRGRHSTRPPSTKAATSMASAVVPNSPSRPSTIRRNYPGTSTTPTAIGIVLLAGVEVLKLKRYLQSQPKEKAK